MIVEAVRLARKNRTQVKTEAVHVCLLYPIAQAVRDHLQHARMTEIDGVARSSIVDVVAFLVRQQTIIISVINSFEAQRRALFVAFSRVVVDDIQNYLQAGIVEASHHLFKLAQAVLAAGSVTWIRREKTNRVISPIVGQILFEQLIVVDKGMYGQKLNGSDSERLDIADHFLGGQSRVGSAQFRRHGRMLFGVAFDVQLVKNRVVPGNQPAAQGLVFPSKFRIDNRAFGHILSAVALIKSSIVARFHNVAEDGGMPFQLAIIRASIGIKQELVRIKTMSRFRRVGAMNAIAVNRAGRDIRDVPVPDLVCVLRQCDAVYFPFPGIENTNFDLGRVG